MGNTGSSISNGLLIADVAHARVRPARNAFHYGVYYLCFALDEMARLSESTLVSLNRFNLFSFYEKDHTGKNMPVEHWIKAILTEWNIPQADGRVVLLTLPRLFGYVFNPVSFWFCLDKSGQLRAVLSEVCNTFGERHSYVSFHDDRRPIGPDDILESKKVFHVSPFIEIKGFYRYRFAYREDKVGVWIDHHDEDGLMLTTSLTGKRIPLTSCNLLRYFFRYPLVTLKVIGLIHYQAVKLIFKGVKYRRCPTPPSMEVSR